MRSVRHRGEHCIRFGVDSGLGQAQCKAQCWEQGQARGYRHRVAPWQDGRAQGYAQGRVRIKMVRLRVIGRMAVRLRVG